MDLEHRGHGARSLAILAAYVDRARDPGLYALLDFYAAYRAIVRFKVDCLRSKEMEKGARKRAVGVRAGGFFELAYRCSVRFSRPTLWVFHGLPASGKSTLAEGVAEALGLALFRSDGLRKEKGRGGSIKPEVVPYGQGSYNPLLRGAVYARLLALAQENLKRGRSVALDATFSRRKWRAEALRLAADLDTNILFVECSAGRETLAARLVGRESASGVSDARLEHLPKMIEEYDPADELPPDTALRADTERPLEGVLFETLSRAYAKKCAQVEKLLKRVG
jgi:hypothetical protein